MLSKKKLQKIKWLTECINRFESGRNIVEKAIILENLNKELPNKIDTYTDSLMNELDETTKTIDILKDEIDNIT